MSTNFYATLDTGDVSFRIHLGKRSSNGNISTLSGYLYPDWKTMKALLTGDNASNFEIVDEYDGIHTVDAFINMVEETSYFARAKQYDAVLEEHPELIGETLEAGRFWLDDEGFTFYGGDFS